MSIYARRLCNRGSRRRVVLQYAVSRSPVAHRLPEERRGPKKRGKGQLCRRKPWGSQVGGAKKPLEKLFQQWNVRIATTAAAPSRPLPPLQPFLFQGYTALLIACHSGTLDLAALLVDNGASLRAVTSRRMSALHLAAEGGDVDLVRMLLLAGVGFVGLGCECNNVDRGVQSRHARL